MEQELIEPDALMVPPELLPMVPCGKRYIFVQNDIKIPLRSITSKYKM